MRILLTGGTGEVGRTTTDRLVNRGHEVRVIGRRSGLSIDGAEYRSCDILDYQALKEHVGGCDAVVHLAAVPNPWMGPSEKIFETNCSGAFNVYQAAAEEGITRVVNASSVNAIGYFWGSKEFELSYLPVDEAHPACTTDPYSFSKQTLEEIAAYFWRREGISGVSLRFPWVYEPTEEILELLRSNIRWAARRIPELLSLRAGEQAAFIHRLRATTRAAKANRLQEKKDEMAAFLDEEQRKLFTGRYNLWTNIDARDAAQAIDRAVSADFTGSHPVFVNDSHNSAGVESRILARLFYPDVSVDESRLKGTESLISIDRARKLLEFEPSYSLSRYYS